MRPMHYWVYFPEEGVFRRQKDVDAEMERAKKAKEIPRKDNVACIKTNPLVNAVRNYIAKMPWKNEENEWNDKWPRLVFVAENKDGVFGVAILHPLDNRAGIASREKGMAMALGRMQTYAKFLEEKKDPSANPKERKYFRYYA